MTTDDRAQPLGASLHTAPGALTERLSVALADRYRIERHLGAGGMATVYLAHDVRHDRKVAVKVLKPELAAVLGADRFVVEIKTTASLQHPHILPLFDSGTADGFLYYVMPYIQGETIREKLNRETQFGVEEAVRIAREVADALDYAHRHGVIHRDIKPENILLHDGRAMVMDFGIALAVSAAAGGRMTETGLSLGTPHYMSPEQATADKEISGRSDLYSLGSVLYEMLAGQPPHLGGSAQQIIMKIITEPVQPVTTLRKSVPPNVAAAVAKSLEKLPADRFESAKAFGDALANQTFTLPTTGVAARAIAGGVPVRLFWTMAAVAVVALGTTLWGWLRTPSSARPSSVEFELALPDSFLITGSSSAASLALSRDGTTLVFGGKRGRGDFMLFTRRLDDRFVQEIRGTEGARSPVLSPDGSEVLFALPATAGSSPIRRISIRGGVARTFSETGPSNGQISWGDGDTVVIAIADTLWLMSAGGGSRALLAAPDRARHARYGFPDILPDGKAALISIWKGRRPVLDSVVVGVVSIPDGKVTELGVVGLQPRYSTTGHLLYSTVGGTLFAVPFDARTRRVTGKPSVVAENVTGGSGGAVPLAVARNGTLAFIPTSDETRRGELTPVAVDRAGRERSLGAKRAVYRTPRVSPDGRQIAFVVGDRPRGGLVENPDIWRFDVATATLQRVTTDRMNDQPIWTPDGLQIVYSHNPPDSVLFSIPLYAGARPAPFVRAPGGLGTGDIAVAHGYAAFTVVNSSAVPSIWLVHLDSLSKPRPFVAEAYGAALPRLSSDGRLIAYMTSRTGRSEVYVRQVSDVGEEVQVSADGGVDPVWSPDGREIYYRTPDSLMAARIAVTPRLAVTGRQSLFPLARYGRTSFRSVYDIFPTGREFVMLSERSDSVTQRTPLVVRLNWSAVLGARLPTTTP